jgi:hypothetical protein
MKWKRADARQLTSAVSKFRRVIVKLVAAAVQSVETAAGL